MKPRDHDRSGARVVRPPLPVLPPGFRRFELKEEMPLGGGGNVYWVRYHGGTWKRVKDGEEDATFAVVDRLAQYACPMVRAVEGEEEQQEPIHGLARFYGDSQEWEIVALQMPARGIQFTFASDMLPSEQGGTPPATGSATVTTFWGGVDPLRFWADGEVPLLNPGNMFEGYEDSVGLALWDDAELKYRIIQVEC